MNKKPYYSVSPLRPIYPEPEEVPSARRRWILVREKSVAYLDNPNQGTVLSKDPPIADLSGSGHYLGMRDDLVLYAWEPAAGEPLPDGWEISPVRELSGKVPDSEVALASYAVRILEFDRMNRFCGRCGAKTRPAGEERARVCMACNSVTYPRISPAVIVLVKKGDEILLVRSPRSPPGFFSLIAGFNEPGENLEETVHREVAEEAGIRVQNLRYFRSEPWPFPDSLMAGFVADYAGGDIRVDNREIEEACWFFRETLPSRPWRESISRDLIEAWMIGEI